MDDLDQIQNKVFTCVVPDDMLMRMGKGVFCSYKFVIKNRVNST